MDEAEVGDDLSLVLFVAELPKKRERLLGTSLCESKGEIVQRHRLRLVVPEVSEDRERHTMLRGGLLGVAAPSELRTTLVEAQRAAPPPEGGNALIESRGQPAAGVEQSRGQRRRPIHRPGVPLTAPLYEGMCAIGSFGRHGASPGSRPSSPFANAELVDSRPKALSCSSGRFQGCFERLINRDEGSSRCLPDGLAAQQPDASDDDRNEDQDGCRDQDDDDEGQRSQQPGQEEPERDEREQASPPSRPIRCHRRARSFTTRSPSGTAALRLAKPCSCLPAAANRTNHRRSRRRWRLENDGVPWLEPRMQIERGAELQPSGGAALHRATWRYRLRSGRSTPAAELLWLPPVVTGAAWPSNVRPGACRRRLRRDNGSVPPLPPDDL